MHISYRYIRPSPVLYVRGIGAYADSVAAAWRAMTAWLDGNNARHLVRGGLGIFHDDPATTTPDALRYDACIGLAPGSALEADAEAGVGRQTFSGGAYAVHLHSGPNELIGELFSSMRRETVSKRGLSIDHGRPFIAIYLNDPLQTREAHRRTEVCIPVIPLRMPLSSNDDSERDSESDSPQERFRA